jgi:hypothetical protein
MNTFIKTFIAATMVLVFFGCEPEEDTVPLVNNQSFTESELMDLVDQSVFSDPNSRHKRASVSFSSVYDIVNGGVEVGKSLLLRKKGKGVAMALKTNMIPDHAATIWWIIWNSPENCKDDPCGSKSDADFNNAGTGPGGTALSMMYAAGNIIRRSGVGTFHGYLKEGVIQGSINDQVGVDPLPLLDAKKAEIHLVVRSHGPRIPGMEDVQTSSYDGGCIPPGFLPFEAIPTNPGECGDIHLSEHLP